MKEKLMIIGGGGHTASIISAMHKAGLKNIKIIDTKEKLGLDVLGERISSSDDDFESLAAKGYSFVIGVGSIKNNHHRIKLFKKAQKTGLKPFTFIAESSIIGEGVEIGDGTVIMEGAIVNTRAKIGKNTIVNTGALVEHDCIIGDDVHIAPGVKISGGVRIGNGAFIGIGAVIIQRCCIGERTVIAADATVIDDVENDIMVAGVPAEKIKDL